MTLSSIRGLLFVSLFFQTALFASAVDKGDINGHPELFPSRQDKCSSYLYNENQNFDGFKREGPSSCWLPEFQYNPDAIDLYITHLENKGIGFNQGYTTLGLRTAPLVVKQWPVEVLFDVKGHIFNNGKWASNIGLGGRVYFKRINKVLGLNLYYDFRNDERSYNQIGIGFEMLGADFDLSMNGYIPVGGKSYSRTTQFINFPSGGFAYHVDHQRALTGFSADVGTSLRRWYQTEDWDVTIGAGPYYYGGHGGDHVRGGQFRFGIEYISYITLEMRVSCDNVYNGIVQGIFGLNFTFGGKPSLCPNAKVPRVQRNEIIVLDDSCTWKIVPRHKVW